MVANYVSPADYLEFKGLGLELVIEQLYTSVELG